MKNLGSYYRAVFSGKTDTGEKVVVYEKDGETHFSEPRRELEVGEYYIKLPNSDLQKIESDWRVTLEFEVDRAAARLHVVSPGLGTWAAEGTKYDLAEERCFFQ